MIPAKAEIIGTSHRLMIIETSRKAEHIKWFLTDVLLFTHLLYTPLADTSKTYPMNIRFA